jgi:hypothetical protein
MSNSRGISDQVIREKVLDPVGGLDKFRLIACPGFKLIQYSDGSGNIFDLVIEDEDLAGATVSFLERCRVPEITRKI